MEHTKEPWKANINKETTPHEINIFSKITGDTILSLQFDQLGYGNESEVKANAERIVTCVNAMQGLTNEQVTELRETVKELYKALENCICVTNGYNISFEQRMTVSKSKDLLTRSKHLS